MARTIRVAFSLTIALILTFGSSGARAAQQPSPSPHVTLPSRTGTGAVLNPPDPRSATGPTPKPTMVTFDPAMLARQKKDAQIAWNRALAAAKKTPTPKGTAAVVSGANQSGLANSDNNLLTTSKPSDSTGAIGPSNYVEMVNQRIAAYDRSLNRIGNTVDMADFANFNHRNVTMTDPQVEWDAQANRWLYAVLGLKDGGNYLFYGWTKTNDPTALSITGWCRWELSTGNDDMDYPKLGHDAKSIVIGANLSNYPAGASKPFPFITASILVFKKPATGVQTCTQPSFTQFGSSKKKNGNYIDQLKNFDNATLTVTPVPANITDNGTTNYIVSATYPDIAAPAINLKHLTYANNGNPNGVVNDADIPVAAYLNPPAAPQGNSANYLDALDTRLTQAVARADPDASGALAIWTQHTIAESAAPQPHVRWYEIVTTTKSIRQSGGEAGGLSVANFNGAISPTIDGNEAVLIYNQSSSSALATIVAQSRLSSTPLGQMDPAVTAIATVGTSPSAENDDSCGGTPDTPCRWGDYSAATPDPLYAHTVWGTNALTGEGALGFAEWTTRNFGLKTLSTPYCLTTTIAAGYYHSLAAAIDGTVWAWGATGYGQVGHGPTGSNQLTPVQVLGPGGVGLLTGISSVAAGQYHSVAVRGSDGTIWTWGNNFDGELGNNDATGTNQNTPVQVVYAQDGSPLTGFSEIASRNSHSLAIRRSDGTVWTWGLNSYGQLGDSTQTLRRGAVEVKGQNGVGFLTNIVKVAAGDNFSVAIDSTGSVYAWGDDSAGQLGDNRSGFGVMSLVPVQVHGINNVGSLAGGLKVVARASGADVIDSDNTVAAWGTGNQPSALTPRIVPTSSGTGSLFPIFAIGASFNNTYAADYTDNTLWAWGDNTYGQVGDGTTTFRPNPTHVHNFGDAGLLASVFYASGGVGHSMAVLQSGALATWGHNDAGQLGDGTTANRSIPYQIAVPAINTPTSC